MFNNVKFELCINEIIESLKKIVYIQYALHITKFLRR